MSFFLLHFGHKNLSSIRKFAIITRMSGQATNSALNASRLTSRSRYWMVTINSEDGDPEGARLQRSIDEIRALFDNGDIEYSIGSLEIGGIESRLHIQAYVVLRRVQRGSWLAARVYRAYVIASRFAIMNAGIAYCNDPTKEGYQSKAFEFGNIPGAGQGKRTDLETVDEAIKSESAVTFRDVNDIRCSVAARHPNWVSWRLAEANRDAYLREDRYRDQYKPRVWQHWLNVYLTDCRPDERKVIFVTDRIGHAGKSRFCDEFERSSGKRCQVLRPASKRDMVASLENRREVLFIDVPRGKHQFMATVYVFMEEAKDGKLVSEKYNSHTRYQPLMHLVVFMNEEVDIGSAGGVLTVKDNGLVKTKSYSEPVPAPLSHDRYAIWDLNRSMLEEYSIDHPKYGNTFPPFRGYDEEFRVNTYIPPLIPSSGPEFNGDIAGDGPVSFGTQMTPVPEYMYVRVRYTAYPVDEVEYDDIVERELDPTTMTWRVINNFKHWPHVMRNVGTVIDEYFGLETITGSMRRCMVVADNGVPVYASPVDQQEIGTVYVIHRDNIPLSVLSRISSPNVLIDLHVDIDVYDYQDLVVPIGAPCA